MIMIQEFFFFWGKLPKFHDIHADGINRVTISYYHRETERKTCSKACCKSISFSLLQDKIGSDVVQVTLQHHSNQKS